MSYGVGMCPKLTPVPCYRLPRLVCAELSLKVVHIRDHTAVLVRSKNDVLIASNVHFVVHSNAKLVLSGKHAIAWDRDEV